MRLTETIPNDRFNNHIEKHEKEVLAAFDRLDRWFVLEWHRRARKTSLAINLLIRECCRNNKAKYIYVAPTQVWARNIVWDDPTMIWDAMPTKEAIFWKKSDQKMLLTFANGSMLKVAGSDEPDAIRGIDASGAVFDEWALHKPAVWTEVFRSIMAGEPIEGAKHARWAMFLYTPKGTNHATQMFDYAACIESEVDLPVTGKAEKCKPEWFASRLTADESGIIPQRELDKMLEDVENGIITRIEYEQEMRCKRVTDEERTLITSAMLDKLSRIDRELLKLNEGAKRRIVAIDPAFGGDVCAIKGFEDGRVVAEKNVHHTLTSEVIFEAKEMARRVKTPNFIVDCIGVGKGVADGLHNDKANYNVQYFNSAGKVKDSDLFANLKAEAVYYCAQKIRRFEVGPVKDKITKRQLIALSRYKIQPGSGLMIMISNDDVKKEIGNSPDQGLCWIYGIYGLQFVKPLEDFIRESEEEFTTAGSGSLTSYDWEPS